MPERRGTRRYTLSLPIETWGPGQPPIKGMTREISSRGVYFVIDHPLLRDATSLQFLMTLPPRKSAGSVFIRGQGRAVRVDSKNQPKNQCVGIAAQILSCEIVRSSDPLDDDFSVPSHLLLQMSHEGAGKQGG